MTAKKWTYKQLTAAAEYRIKAYMGKALAEKDNMFLQRLYLAWAYGAFTLWDELTRDMQEEYDKTRLRALALNLQPWEQ